MADITLRGNPFHTVGDLPAVGDDAPDFTLTGTDLSNVTPADLGGSAYILNIFPSIDTATCATSVRTFNAKAAESEGVNVVCVSADLPFAQGRFCGAEGIDKVRSASTFRSSFGDDFGVAIADGPMAGLLARAVVVVGSDGKVTHSQLVSEIADEPDYDAALSALG